MNKVVIDFPPGGCGHFLARLLNDEYSFEVGERGEYHSLHHEYNSITTTKENFKTEFVKNISSDQNVICLHNFDNFPLEKFYPDHKLINIYIDGMYNVFVKNFYMKAISSHDRVLDNYHRDNKEKFQNSPCPLREEFYCFYSWVQTSDWAKEKTDYINLPFSYIYQVDILKKFLIDYGFTIPNNFLKIHEDFMIAQQSILNITEIYNNIIEAIESHKNLKIPEFFTDVDRGIVSAMIYQKLNIDLLNVHSIEWFSDTKQIWNYKK